MIGAGIIGAGIASVAARHGLAVALVDRGDFGGATSSSSSKLIHGGLRYLRLGDVRLVREAHEERRHLMNVVAPHLVHQIPFLLPLYENGPVPALRRPGGNRDLLDTRESEAERSVEPARARRMVPDLRVEGLRKRGLQRRLSHKRQSSHARKRPRRRRRRNHSGQLRRGSGTADRAGPGERRGGSGRRPGRLGAGEGGRRRRAMVGQPAPDGRPLGWQIDPPRAKAFTCSSTRVTTGRRHSLIPHDKVRVSFASPWEGTLLLGTTDALHEGGSRQRLRSKGRRRPGTRRGCGCGRSRSHSQRPKVLGRRMRASGPFQAEARPQREPIVRRS